MSGNDILHASSISPQVLLSQQLGTTDTALYTVASGQSVKLAQGTLCNVTASMTPPVLTLGATSTTGGSLAAGTYYWVVTAFNAGGETLASNEVTATTTGTTSSQPLTCTAPVGATSYHWYRGTTSGGENTMYITTTPSFTDTGAAGTTVSPTKNQGTGMPVPVYLSIIKSGGTLGDGTHRILNNVTLAANDTLSLKDYISGAMLGPGDAISAYTSALGAVDIVLTGTVHA